MDSQLVSSTIGGMEMISKNIGSVVKDIKEAAADIPTDDEKIRVNLEAINAAVKKIEHMAAVLGFMKNTIVKAVADAETPSHSGKEEDEEDEEDEEEEKGESSGIRYQRTPEVKAELIAMLEKFGNLGIVTDTKVGNRSSEEDARKLRQIPDSNTEESPDGDEERVTTDSEDSDDSYSSDDSSDKSSDEYVLSP